MATKTILTPLDCCDEFIRVGAFSVLGWPHGARRVEAAWDKGARDKIPGGNGLHNLMEVPIDNPNEHVRLNDSHRVSSKRWSTGRHHRIDPKTAEEFLDALKDLRQIRLRDGAIRWNVLRDSADPERYLEIFVTESWGEHLRQHERITAEDRKVEQGVQAFHVSAQPPKTTHLIAEELPK